VIPLTWRQFRTSALVAAVVLIAVGGVLIATGPHLAHLYRATVGACVAGGDCSATQAAFLRHDSTLRVWLGVIVVVVPGISGVFWGAPLVAGEMEAGTFSLAWTQSVTRTRWMATKLAVIGAASVAAAGLLSLMVTWWARSLDRVQMNQFATFDERSIVPLGYAAFAFVLGVTAGVVLRRSLPAMAVTFVAFVATRLAFLKLLRPHLLAPSTMSIALDPVATGFGSSGSLFSRGGPDTLQPPTPNIPNAWITATRIVDRGGHVLTSQILTSTCPGLGDGGPPAGGAGGGPQPVPAAAQQQLRDCVTTVGRTFHQAVTYQPASHYWPLQWYELALFVGAALVLSGFCLWWVRRLT
jgi:ABC-type transport system involved in multi-copper enzyme maturation permease subunit